MRLVEQENKKYDDLQEKWKKDVDIKSTGEYENKTIEELEKMKNELKGKEPFTDADKEKMSEIIFAIRAKGGWKKGEGATK